MFSSDTVIVQYDTSTSNPVYSPIRWVALPNVAFWLKNPEVGKIENLTVPWGECGINDVSLVLMGRPTDPSKQKFHES